MNLPRIVPGGVWWAHFLLLALILLVTMSTLYFAASTWIDVQEVREGQAQWVRLQDRLEELQVSTRELIEQYREARSWPALPSIPGSR